MSKKYKQKREREIADIKKPVCSNFNYFSYSKRVLLAGGNKAK